MTQAERDRLVALKKAKKKVITQKQAAVRAGVAENTWQRWEAGRKTTSRDLKVLLRAGDPPSSVSSIRLICSLQCLDIQRARSSSRPIDL